MDGTTTLFGNSHRLPKGFLLPSLSVGENFQTKGVWRVSKRVACQPFDICKRDDDAIQYLLGTSQKITEIMSIHAVAALTDGYCRLFQLGRPQPLCGQVSQTKLSVGHHGST